MNKHLLCWVWLVLVAVLGGAGCAAEGKLLPIGQQPENVINPKQVQTSTISYATRFIAGVSDVYDQVQGNLPTLELRMLAQQDKLNACQGALNNAVNPNPVLGLMDMSLMVTLIRATAEDPWVQEQYGAENATKIREVFKAQEVIIWQLAGEKLTPEQVKELKHLAEQWRQEHLGQRNVAGVRLADFSEPKHAGGGFGVANSIFNLVKLDPFGGLDPAVRQVEESRILAERLFFYTQYMPMLVSWQTDVLYNRMMMETLRQPKVTKLLNDTSTVTASTKEFSDASSRFAEYCGDFARTIEKFRADLPAQQATLMKQLDEIVAKEREAALKQATKDLDVLIATQRDAALKQVNADIETQRKGAIDQLGSTVQSQQDLMAKNLKGVMDDSIDRLYERLWRVVVTAAVAILIVLVIYRVMVRLFFEKKGEGKI
jgi:hypothetical protein